MKGDFSRDTFDKSKHYNSVLMQQGRVQLDADWNEQQAISSYLRETEARDIIGKCGTPAEDPGFEIKFEDGTLKIGRGRYYVDGILCENEEEIDYNEQVGIPPNPLNRKSLGLVYLDVWNRHITTLDDPDIKEKALGNPDTATRGQTVWQVKILPIKKLSKSVERQRNVPDGPQRRVKNLDLNDLCNKPFEEWEKLTSKRNVTMEARINKNEIETPCYLPPEHKYQGIENQLYRIEIHEGGSYDKATFKWSRDNGSVVTAIKGINGTKITVSDLGKDDILSFKEGQWVEISDDSTELNGDPGFMTQIKKVNSNTREIELVDSCKLNFNDIWHPKLRRWDGACSNIMQTTRQWLEVERGIEIKFSPSGEYKTGDYWLIPARTATGDIEWPSSPQHRKGIEHHYCRLSLLYLEKDKYTVYDCRKKFPSLSGLKEEESISEKTGIQITSVNIKYSNENDEIELVNDSEIDFDKLEYFLVKFNKNIEEIFIPTYKEKLINPIFFVTVYIPFPILFLDSGIGHNLYSESIVGYQPLILSADLEKHDDMLKWVMKGNTKGWITALLELLKGKLNRFQRQLLARLTLKGNFIWAKDTPDMYLDGDTFGIEDNGRIGLQLPSGDERKGGNFEMWFWLT